MGKRAIHLDAVGGILIMWMIFVHVQALTQCFFVKNRWMPFLFCFMGWFFFKAGMFFHDKPFKKELHTVWKRLLIPYLTFSVIGFLVGVVLLYIYHNESLIYFTLRSIGQVVRWGGVTSNMPIWFLLSLAVVRIVFLLANKRNATIPLILISVVIAYLLSRYEINEPSYLGNISLGMFFFGMGYMLKDYQYNRWVVLIAAVIYVFCYVLFPSNVDVRANYVTSGTYLGFLVYALCAIILLNNIFLMIPFLFADRVLVHIGQNSMSYYLLHWPLITLVLGVLHIFNSNLSNTILCIISLLVCVVILPLLNKLFHISKMKVFIGE